MINMHRPEGDVLSRSKGFFEENLVEPLKPHLHLSCWDGAHLPRAQVPGSVGTFFVR